MLHVGQYKTVTELWQSLEAMHEMKGHQMIIGIMRNLFCTVADNDMNISEHLNTLKLYWEQINQINNNNLRF